MDRGRDLISSRRLVLLYVEQCITSDDSFECIEPPSVASIVLNGVLGHITAISTALHTIDVSVFIKESQCLLDGLGHELGAILALGGRRDVRCRPNDHVVLLALKVIDLLEALDLSALQMLQNLGI